MYMPSTAFTAPADLPVLTSLDLFISITSCRSGKRNITLSPLLSLTHFFVVCSSETINFQELYTFPSLVRAWLNSSHHSQHRINPHPLSKGRLNNFTLAEARVKPSLCLSFCLYSPLTILDSSSFLPSHARNPVTPLNVTFLSNKQLYYRHPVYLDLKKFKLFRGFFLSSLFDGMGLWKEGEDTFI